MMGAMNWKHLCNEVIVASVWAVLFAVTFAVLAWAFGLGQCANAADSFVEGKVLHVVDGDTFDIGDQRIRLCGVQAPERGQEGFYRSAGYVAVRYSGRPLRCIPVGAGTPCDGRSSTYSWGRLVAQCFYKGKDVARALVDRGFAVDWPIYSGGYYKR